VYGELISRLNCPTFPFQQSAGRMLPPKTFHQVDSISRRSAELFCTTISKKTFLGAVMAKSDIERRIVAIGVPKVELAALANATPQDVSAWVLGRSLPAYKRDRLDLALDQCEKILSLPGVRPEPTAQNIRRAIAEAERKSQSAAFSVDITARLAAAEVLSTPRDTSRAIVPGKSVKVDVGKVLSEA
jgi:hypothetical protein